MSAAKNAVSAPFTRIATRAGGGARRRERLARRRAPRPSARRTRRPRGRRRRRPPPSPAPSELVLVAGRDEEERAGGRRASASRLTESPMSDINTSSVGGGRRRAVKAVVFHEFGGLDVLRLEEVDDPQPGPGEVVLDVAASAPQPPRRRHPRGRLAVPDRAPAHPRRRGRRPRGRDRLGGQGLAAGRSRDGLPDGRLQGLPLLPHGPRVALRRARLRRVLDVRRLRGEDRRRRRATSSGYRTACPTRRRRRCRSRSRPPGTCCSPRPARAGETVLINSVGSGIGSAAVQLASIGGATIIGNGEHRREARAGAELGMHYGINHASRTWSPR